MDLSSYYDGIYRNEKNERFLVESHKLYLLSNNNELVLYKDNFENEEEIKDVMQHLKPWITMNTTFSCFIQDSKKNEECHYLFYDLELNQIITQAPISVTYNLSNLPDDIQVVDTMNFDKTSHCDIVKLGNVFYETYHSDLDGDVIPNRLFFLKEVNENELMKGRMYDDVYVYTKDNLNNSEEQSKTNYIHILLNYHMGYWR